MSERESGRSRELDEVRRMLFPDLSPEEGWRLIDRAAEGAADPERWARVELTAELIERIRGYRDDGPEA